MNAALIHRGPDEGGVAEVSCGVVGMQRLSIIDVEHGHQPMTTGDGRYTLVYNGELYDYRDLRRTLEGRGCRFRTNSDTEVLLQALVLDGHDAVSRLNGMFGFAFIDRDTRTAILARDHVGIKPLYYHVTSSGDLIFSSELASLMAHPLVPRRIDHRSLASLLVDRYVIDPWTMFDGVRQLPPGSYLRWADGQIDIQRYYRYEPVPEAMDETTALEGLRDCLRTAVRSQLVADVPVGVFLSGGIDSSTVAALAMRAADRPLKSFTVGFPDREFDESELARTIAAYLGTEHYEIQMEDLGFDPALLDLIIDHVGQPMADTSCIPTYAVAHLAREHVKVVLSGDGGDEFFGGYDHMFWVARVQRAARWPRAARLAVLTLLRTVGRGVPHGFADRTRRWTKGIELTLQPESQRLRRLMALWPPEDAESFLADPAASALHPHPVLPASVAALAPEERAMVELAETYMAGAILTKVDRMSMATSVEVRPPLLDQRVIEFARRVPLDLKIRQGVGKYLLREAGRPFLPDRVYRQRKQGFGIPLGNWLNPAFWEQLHDLYAPGSPAASLFRPEHLDRAFREAKGAPAHRYVSEQAAATRVWQLAMIARWMERFGVSS